MVEINSFEILSNSKEIILENTTMVHLTMKDYTRYNNLINFFIVIGRNNFTIHITF